MNRVRDEWTAKNPGASWDDLTPETKATLMNIEEARERSWNNIQTKLLTELENLPELDSFKTVFRETLTNLRRP